MCAARGQQPSGAAAAVGAGISVAFEQPLPSCKRVCEGKKSGKQRALSVCVLRYMLGVSGVPPLSMQTAKLVSRLLQ